MSDRSLVVIVAHRVAGTLFQRANGDLEFSYEPGYDGIPLSLSMPPSGRVYRDPAVRPYLLGLLPDSREVRTDIGREHGVSGENPFSLLSHIGLDCPGAVQVCKADQIEDALEQHGGLTPLSDEDIEARLRRTRENRGRAWEARNERWSLAGAQTKFALRREGGIWNECSGSSATTHIFKNGVAGYQNQALDEFVCLRTAAACGIPSSRCEFETFGSETALIVERYDRIRVDDEVVRLHQEDMCQLLGVRPENKYPGDGGPTAVDVLDAIARYASSPTADAERFVRMLFFNFLIGATDAHAKNYSFLIGPDGLGRLAPFYDVASILPYTEPYRTYRTAMGIGGENRLGWLRPSVLSRFAKSARLERFGLDVETCTALLLQLATDLPEHLSLVLDSTTGVPGTEELHAVLEPAVASLCAGTLERFSSPTS